MIVYMTHPEHGTHICYSEDEVKECEKLGWTAHGPNPPVKNRPILTLPKKRGRPKKGE